MSRPGQRARSVLPPTEEVDALLGRIRPPQDRLDLASALPAKLRAHIEGTRHLKTAEPHTRLSGSYGRHVSTHQIKDVDVVVLADPSYRTLGPERLLEDLEVAVKGFAARRKTGKVERRRQRRSVRVTFTDDDFYVDLVPALAPNGPEGVLEIPDRENSRWVKTASLRYGSVFSQLNAKSKGALVHLVLLLRHWQLEHCQNVRVKGFWLEALTVHLLTQGDLTPDGRPLFALAADAFDALYAYCERAKGRGAVPVIPDPVLGGNVASLWTKDEFDGFFDCLRDAHDQVQRTRTAKTEDEATRAWQRIFGSAYLAPTPELVQAAQALAGVASVSAVGYVLLRVLLGKR